MRAVHRAAGLAVVTRMLGTVRTIHRLAGLAALPFLAVYWASGVRMAHRNWWPIAPRVTEQSYALPKGLTDAREVARRLPLRGELTAIHMPGPVLLITRPGASYLVSYSASTGEGRVRTTAPGLLGALVRVHQIMGVGHEYRPLDAWAGALALVSAALLIMGATGLWLWFANRSERRSGFVLLAAGAGMALALIVSMRL